MNEKEFNLQVLAKLVEIANVIFAKLTINIEGTFTAAELWEGKNSLNENIVIDYHGTQFDTYTVEVGTFKCSFTPEKVFYLVWKFEKLCRVHQENKARFAYGIEKREIITGKAMYIGNGGKVIKRKKTLVRLSEHVAYEPCKIYEWVYLYYFVDGIWYYISQVQSKHQREKIAGRMENEPEWFKNLLANWDYTQDIAINTIYKALRNVLCTEAIKDTPEERKSENEAGNAVSGESLRNRPIFTKPFRNHIVMVRRLENGAYHCKQFLLNEVGNGLYRDADNLYFEHEERLYILGGYTRGVASFLKEQTDIKAKIVSMIEEGGISAESAKILYEKLTGHTLGKTAKVEPVHEEEHEDYPPEPYNKEKSENVATSYERFQDRTICGRFQKNMCPNYLRQKVFPTESFQSRCKIRRFKPRCFVGYTNYQLNKESALERKRNGNTRVYRTLIRGETEIGIV